MHLRGVLEAIQSEGNRCKFGMYHIIVLSKPHDQVWICKNSVCVWTLPGNAKCALAGYEDVGFANEPDQEAFKQVAFTRMLGFRVYNWHLWKYVI